MRRLAASVIIQRDPETVFEFLSSPANAPRWLPGVRSIEVAAPPRPHHGGSWRMLRDIGTREAALDVDVVEYRGPDTVPLPYRFGLAAMVAGTAVEWRYRVQSAGPGASRVELLVESGRAGLLARLAHPVVMRALHATDATQLAALKAALEAPASPR